MPTGRYAGPAYPLGPSPAGTWGPKPDLNVLFTSIVNILKTPKGSVPYDLNIGSVVPELVFDQNDEVTLGLIRHFTFKDITEQEPRVVVERVFTEREDDHTVHVTVGVSVVGDPDDEVHNVPVKFTREAG